ncbi:MAG: histidine kinase [Ferruginibacter sp.]
MLYISSQLKDRYFKLSGIPITVALVTVLYNFFNAREKINWAFSDYIFLLLLAFCTWFSNVRIHFLLRKQLYNIKKVVSRLFTRHMITIAFTFLITLVLLNIWNYLLHAAVYKYHTILTLQVIIILISLQIGSIYEIIYLSNERESDIVMLERTEKSKVQAQLDGLKSQIDPHFIFNSLNTLSYLISQSQENAKLFNDTLARVYRYILVKKEKDLVLLKEEIEFTTNYFYLLKIRYQQGLIMKIEIDDIVSENYLLPPMAIQMLIENAIKHNHFTEKQPLVVHIFIAKDQVTVTNNRNIKQFEIQSSKIGLKNLTERYKLITNNNISVNSNKEIFKVTLPILKS